MDIKTNEIRKVMLTTAGDILVEGDMGIAKITDPEFLGYIKKGMKLKDVELDTAAEETAKVAYEEKMRKEENSCKGIESLSGFFSGDSVTVTLPEQISEPVSEPPRNLYTEHPRNLRPDPLFPHIEDIDIDTDKTWILEKTGDKDDPVNHPKHYTSHPSGIECIEIARHYDFDIGNAIKYLWRHGLKSEEGKEDLDKAIEDLEKAIWYIKDEIASFEKTKKPATCENRS